MSGSDDVVQILFIVRCDPVIDPCVKVISVAPVVGKVGEPFAGDKYRLVPEEFTIRTAGFCMSEIF